MIGLSLHIYVNQGHESLCIQMVGRFPIKLVNNNNNIFNLRVKFNIQVSNTISKHVKTGFNLRKLKHLLLIRFF